MEKKISLLKTATDIEKKSDTKNKRKVGQSYKTLIRRFDEMCEKFKIDRASFENINGNVFFKEKPAILTGIMLEISADKKSLIYKLLKDSEAEITFEDLEIFLETVHNLLIEKGIGEDERASIMFSMDNIFRFKALQEIVRIHELIDKINENLCVSIYHSQLYYLKQLRQSLEAEVENSITITKQYAEDLAVLKQNLNEAIKHKKQNKNMTNKDNEEYDLTKMDYDTRDINVLHYLKKNPSANEDIEKKIKEKVEEIFRKHKESM
jgi:hypothetical protein